MAYEEDRADAETGSASGQYGGFSTAGGGVTINGNHFAPAMAFQMTLANNGSSTADVGTIPVVFTDSTGADQGSVTAASRRPRPGSGTGPC